MMKSFITAAGLVAAASAYTQPGAQTYGALLNPDVNHPVTTGQDFTVTWTPKSTTDGATVALVLCNGPSTNCVLQSSAIVDGISAAAGSYTWNVPCSLSAGVQNTDTGYGMLIIVDGTGEFQYSTQFSVNTGSSCSSSSSTTAMSSSSSTPVSSSTMTSTTSVPGSSSSSMMTSTMSVSSSPSSTMSASGQPSSSTMTDGWYGWSGFNTTTTAAGTASSLYTTGSAVMTTSASASYMMSSSSSATAASAKASTYTGAATMPTGFINAAGIVGAVAVAMFAL